MVGVPVLRSESFALNSLHLPRSRTIRALLASAALAGLVGLGGCDLEGVQISAKHLQPIPAATVSLMEKKGMTKEAPILIRVFKEESELEIWKQDSNGEFALLKTYPICRWSGELGPKVKQGDRQAPEGFYTITPAQMNPNSAYYLSFNMGFPNAFDRAHGRTGAHLMVHGNCSSAGCYSMTDEQIGEIFALGRDAFFGGQKSFQVQAYPFRMTAQNMARHRANPHLAFWKMLKEGNDHFEVTRQQPKIDVCDKRYVFNAEAPANMSTPLRFDAAGRCPAYQVPSDVSAAVAAKEKRDAAQFADFVRRGITPAPVKMGQDGGMHPTFLAKLNPQQIRDDKGNVRWLVDNPPPGTAVALTTRTYARDPANDPGPNLANAAPAAAEQPAASGGIPMPRPVPGRAFAAAPSNAAPSNAVAFTASAGSGSAPAKPNMFNGLFSSGPASSVAKVFGFGGEEPKPAAKPVPQVARGPAKPVATAAAKPDTRKDTLQQAELRSSAPAASEPEPAARPASGLITGAAPVVPTQSFENRWSGSR
jgi:murein L,D-transpeptidase YafK